MKDLCRHCGETIHYVGRGDWVEYADTVDHRGNVLHRNYVYDCGDMHDKAHEPTIRQPGPSPEEEASAIASILGAVDAIVAAEPERAWTAIRVMNGHNAYYGLFRERDDAEAAFRVSERLVWTKNGNDLAPPRYQSQTFGSPDYRYHYEIVQLEVQ